MGTLASNISRSFLGLFGALIPNWTVTGEVLIVEWSGQKIGPQGYMWYMYIDGYFWHWTCQYRSVYLISNIKMHMGIFLSDVSSVWVFSIALVWKSSPKLRFRGQTSFFHITCYFICCKMWIYMKVFFFFLLQKTTCRWYHLIIN